MKATSLAGLTLVVLVASCSSQRSDHPTPVPQPTTTTGAPAVSSPFDIGSLVQRARLAFRESADGSLAGGHATYVVSIAPSGVLHYAPRVRDGATRRGWKTAPELSLETISITSGAGAEPGPGRSVGAERAHLEPDGSVRIRRGAVIEHLQNTDAGLEQSWEFAARPRGDEDLVIRVRAAGYAARGGTTGVSFTDASSRSVIQYGAARWVDARGEITGVSVIATSDEIVLSVPRDVVERSAYPAVLDPTVSPEIAFDTPIVGLAGVPDYSVRVAPGKNGSYFVVWMDKRVPRPPSYPYWIGDTQVYGARIAANGTVLDPTGIIVAPNAEQDQDAPVVAFDGVGTWMVAWGQHSFSENNCEIFTAARVSDAGLVMDPAGIRLGCAFTDFDVGFDGTAFQIVGAANALFGWRVPPTGKVNAPSPTQLLPNAFRRVSLACDRKTTCLLAWPGSGGPRVSRVTAGVLVDAVGTLLSPGGSSPHVTFDGTNFVVGWSGGGAYASRVSPATGAVLDNPGILVAASADLPEVDSDGTNTLFVWRNAAGQLSGARLSKAGQPLDASPLALTSAAKPANFAVAGSTGQYLLGWIDERNAAPGLHVGRVTAAGAPLDGDGVPIHRSANREQSPAVARSTTGFLAVWEDWRDGAFPAIYYTRLSGAGTALDVPAKRLAAQGQAATVASDGTDYLVAWSDPLSGVAMNRISAATGKVIGVPAPLAAGLGGASLFYDGTQFVLTSAGANGAQAARIDRAGNVIDATPLSVSGGPTNLREPPIGAFDGQGYLFVYTNGDVMGRRVTKDWALVGAAPFVIATSPVNDDHLGMVYDGQRYVVVWRRALNDDTPRGDIYAARVTTAGALLDSPAIAVATTQAAEIAPAIVAMNDGIGPLVLWSDNRRAGLFDYGIFGALVRSKDGVVLDPGGFAVSNGAGNDFGAAGAPAGPGRALVVYHRTDGAAGFGTARVRARFVESGRATAAACTASSDCASRSCADGVCCDKACNGACETCTKTPGTCTAVASAEDADTCGGDRTCDANAKCVSKLGGPCVVTGECLQGTCSQGVCCDRPCDAACETCAAPRGTCTIRTARGAGEPRCAPYACDGKSATCPTSCNSDDQCPSTGRCDLPTKLCVDGAHCIDPRTLGRPGQPDLRCAPYTCEVAACRTTCRNVADCAYPAICSETGQCVPPILAISVGGGCVIAPGRTSSSRGSALWLVLAALAAARARRCRAARTETKRPTSLRAC